jgi:hypothetical protein
MLLTLHEVGEAVEQGPFVGYSLVFRGAADRPLGQGTYTLTHPETGEVEVFLVPIGPADDGTHQYEAIFSHRIESVNIESASP